MNKWDAHWIAIAEEMANMSKDPSTKVGAVIANGKQLLGTGYNGFPPQIADLEHWLEDRPTKYSMVIHAEMNAVLNALKGNNWDQMQGASLYVTLVPCVDCAKFIVACGIEHIYFPASPMHTTDAGSQYQTISHVTRDIFERAGVQTHAFG